MEARREEPEVFIEGIDTVIRLDLGKHEQLIVQTKNELNAFREAITHESGRKRYYYRLVGSGKFDDGALMRSVEEIRINIRHLTDKAVLAEEKLAHHSLIVDTLTDQLKEYERRYAAINRRLQQADTGNQSNH